MNKLAILAVFALCISAYGQPSGTFLIGPEGTIIASTTGANVVYQFGAGDSWEEVSDASYPLVVDCAVQENCDKLGGDPAPKAAKSIYAVEQAQPYTVTLAGGVPITVPAAGPVTGGVAVATDGQMVLVTSSTAPVSFQYCRGAACNAPFVYGGHALIVGSYAELGGNPSTSPGMGTLYLLPSNSYVGLAVASGPINAISIAATNIAK